MKSLSDPGEDRVTEISYPELWGLQCKEAFHMERRQHDVIYYFKKCTIYETKLDNGKTILWKQEHV